MLFEEYSIKTFIEQLSSDAPSPGGGSTAALVAALSGSLNSMVYSLTVGKKAFEALNNEQQQELLSLQKKSLEFTDKSIDFMEKDREDFVALMASFRMPKDTEEEKEARSIAIQELTYKAMNTPLELAKEAMGFYINIEFAINYGNKNLVSDGVVAAILLHAAIESAVVNVEINLYSLKDTNTIDKVKNECEAIIDASRKSKEALQVKGRKRMGI